jgi:hypothetical protein
MNVEKETLEDIELNVFDAWLQTTNDPTPGGAWKEQQKIVDEQNTALNTAIQMLQKQKKIIEDLKVYYEQSLMDISNLEMENLRLKGKM